MPVSSPLGTILTGVELLLTKAESWQAYAARHVSLEELLTPFKNLVKKWRKMELQSWPQLFRVKEREFNNMSNKWWFRIQAALSEYLRSASDGEVPIVVDSNTSSWSNIPDFVSWSRSKYPHQQSERDLESCTKNVTSEKPQEIFQLLDTFLRGSSVGEFKGRLSLVYSFACQLHSQLLLEAKEGIVHASLMRVFHILYNLHQFYSQYLSSFDNVIQNLKAPIEKKLKVR
jgi:midasin